VAGRYAGRRGKNLSIDDWKKSRWNRWNQHIYSYATVLKRSSANIAYISEILGHNDLKTTENYLASFEKEERIKNASFLTNFGD